MNAIDKKFEPYLSNVPAKMYLPLGENFTRRILTGGFSSSVYSEHIKCICTLWLAVLHVIKHMYMHAAFTFHH